MKHYLRTAAWMIPAITMAVAPAFADAVRLTITETENGARIEARWADGRDGDPPPVEASVDAGVLRLRFAEAVEVDASELAAQAPRVVSFAQADDDGRGVSVALRRDLAAHVGVSGRARIVQLATPGEPVALAPAAGEADAPPPPPAPPENQATVSAGVRDNFTRLTFRFPQPTTVQPRQTGERLELNFSRAADLDLAELRAAPPRFLRNAQITSRPGQPLRIALTVDPGVRQRHFVDGNYAVVDLLPPENPPEQPVPVADADTPPPPENYTPPRAPSAVRVTEDTNATRIVVEFPSPARAAAFRRGGAIWILFEAGGRIDLTGVARAGRRHTDMIPVSSGGMIGLRIPAPPDVLVSARADGNAWTFTLSPRAEAAANAVDVRRDVSLANMGRIIADFRRDGSVKWIEDPEVGDRIAVALLTGPARGVAQRRATLEAALLPSAQGAVIEPRADGVTVAFERGALIVTRGNGLLTSEGQVAGAADSSQDIAELGMEDGGAAPSANVRVRLDELTRAAAAEGVEIGAPVEARLELARFLVRNELAAEALGALRIAAINQPDIEIDPEFRLLRAAANIMMGRSADARADLSASSLADDPAAALWRGYAAFLEENWEEARAQLEQGRVALESFQPEWRARLELARAEAALQSGDLVSAEEAARAAQGQAASSAARLRASLILARAAAARGDSEGALAMFTELTRARDEEVAVRAGLEAVRLHRAAGGVESQEAADLLEAMRFRWRGDALEIDVIATLGEVYMELGRWREALEVMQVAADRYPGAPAARRLRADMVSAFERLFLDGEADRLEPIQALGLFYQFVDLTPVGPNGDRMVRLLAGRLVNVDLLEQACQLLQHQVDERLEGVARAQIAADLAAIYLMDRKPEQAFQAIAGTRVPNIPAALVAERRILEARALLDLGRLDHAVELVERVEGAEGQRVRAEAAWRARDWERASAELNRLLAMRGRATPLTAEDRHVVLRAAIAMTMAGQDDRVRALYREYAGDMAGTDEADPFEIVAAGIDAEGVAVRDLARAVSRTDLLDRYLQRIRTRLTDGAAGATSPSPPPAPPRPPAV